MADFQTSLQQVADHVQAAFAQLLDDAAQPGETARSARLMAAMRHGTLNGGKRLRPFLVVETARLFDVGIDRAIPTALALECIHCYSLIHDDLPAMDDDDLRRGQPTVHRAYDEATAILAGDGLLTLAFEILARETTHRDAAIRIQLVSALSMAAGIGGMVGGQMLDLEAETRRPGENDIRTLQAMKTGALLRFACEAGAILGAADEADRGRMRAFGEKIGAAFQLADDILDVTASTEALGKKAAKDADAGKGTLVTLHGVERASEMARELVDDAQALLAPYGAKAQTLQECARYIVERGK